MPDYIYLLENRLSADQRHALRVLREAAREAGTVLFLTGDAVRDLTSGHAVRELEVAVHGNALKLKKPLEKAGAKVWGEDDASRTLYLCFPGTIRVDIVSTHRVEYPKPGKPIYHWASIQEDLRRRDFTANAMAISLNEGSFGLLMDPLNGAADIEARVIRLVSNYGFLEEPALLIRAIRYRTRLGWELDPRTQTRYENAKAENVMEFLSAQSRCEELEQIGHEEEALKVLEALEAEGWMKVLFPAWTAARADVEGLKALHDQAVDLLLQGVHADMSAAQMQLLTAKLGPKDTSALKKLFIRQGFVEEWNSLDSLAAGFAKALHAKENQTPSACFKLFRSYDPEAILWLGFTTKDSSVRERYSQFLKVWPEARQRIPHALMQEMRITPELPTYLQIVDSVFLELIDGRLTTPEEMRAFLEPHSPPAPPPQITIKRTRARRGAEPKVKEEAFDDEEESEDGLEGEELEDLGGEDEEEIDLGIPIPKADLEADEEESESESEEEEEESEEEEPSPKRGKAAGKPTKPAPAGSKGRPVSVLPAKDASAKPVAKPTPPIVAPLSKEKPGASASAKTAVAPERTAPSAKVGSAPAKSAPAQAAKPATPAKASAKPAHKEPAKASARPADKPLAKAASKPEPKVPAKSVPKQTPKPAKAPPKPSKPAARKPIPKPAPKSGKKR